MIHGHGDDIYLYGSGHLSANFSSNVYPHADLTGLMEHLARRLTCIGSYPEPTPRRLEARLAEVRGVTADHICVTAGITEAIYLIASVFGPIRIATIEPTFSEYADACRQSGHRLVSLYQWPDRGLADDIRLMWICNPNNPTGEARDVRSLIELIDRHPTTVFVIDQSYEAFTPQPLLTPTDAARRTNIIVLHSLTKRYGIPGLRIGYISGSSDLISLIRAHVRPWAVNAPAIEAGLYLCEQEHTPKIPDLDRYLSETARLRQELIGLSGVDVWPTDVHFMLCRLRTGRASALKDYLATEHGLLIRDASNFAGLNESYFRIATQSTVANDQLVNAIRQYLLQP